jgi:hypothetical protein
MADKGRPFWNEWQNSPWSSAENFMPYKEYEALRYRKDSKMELAKAKKAAVKAAKVLKQSRKGAGGN